MSEPVLCVLHNVKKGKSLGRWDTFNVAVTASRCIFAILTAEMLKEAAAEANKAGRAEGKGFFARWGDQLMAALAFGDRYIGSEADAILGENKDNFALQNEEIEAVEFSEKHVAGDKDAVIRRIYGEVVFKAKSGNRKG